MPVTHTVCLLALATAIVTPAVFAAGKPDAENGKTIFKSLCGICHSATLEPGGPVQGPNLVGIVGRKAGTLKDFPFYTPALKNSDIKWNARTLDEFLKSPSTKVPGTMMPIPLPDEQQRADVIAYLETLK
jgi:cytochrome c